MQQDKRYEEHVQTPAAPRPSRLPPLQPAPPPIARIDPRPAPNARLADLGPLLNKRLTAERIGKSESWLNPRPIYIGRSVAWPQAWGDAWISAQVAAQLPGLDRRP